MYSNYIHVKRWDVITHLRTNLSPECRIYASVNLISIGSDNGLSFIRRQAIIWTSAEQLLIGPLGTNFNEILINQNTKLFIQDNAYEKIVCDMTAILSRGRWVNHVLVFTSKKRVV